MVQAQERHTVKVHITPIVGMLLSEITRFTQNMTTEALIINRRAQVHTDSKAIFLGDLAIKEALRLEETPVTGSKQQP